jgi:hypothetical protein
MTYDALLFDSVDNESLMLVKLKFIVNLPALFVDHALHFITLILSSTQLYPIQLKSVRIGMEETAG